MGLPDSLSDGYILVTKVQFALSGKQDFYQGKRWQRPTRCGQAEALSHDDYEKRFLVCIYPVVAVVHAGKVESWEETASRALRNNVRVLENPSGQIAKAGRRVKGRENRDAFSLFFTAPISKRVGNHQHLVESAVRSNTDAVALATTLPQQTAYPEPPHDANRHPLRGTLSKPPAQTFDLPKAFV